MEPQRKRGICLDASPVFARPESRPCSRDAPCGTFAPYASLPHNQQARNLHAQRELTTFKGHKRNSNSVIANEPDRSMVVSDASVDKCEQRLGFGACESPWKKSNDIFQIVPLDDLAPSVQQHQLGQTPPVIEPINLQGISLSRDKQLDAGSQKALGNSSSANLAPPFKFAGFIGTIASAFLFSVAVFCVKLMPIEDTLPEKLKVVMFRGASLMFWTALTILIQGSTFLVRRDEIPLTFIRSVVGFFGSFGFYVAIQYITIAETSALVYSSPLWTCILGYLLLRERLPVTLVAAIPIGALGLVLIAHPDLLLNVQDEIVSELERHHHHVTPPPDYAHHVHQQVTEAAAAAAAASHNLNNSHREPPLEVLAPDEETELYLELRWPGVLMGILTSLVLAVVNICLKFRKSTPIQTTTFYLGLACVLMSVSAQLIMGSFGSWPCTWLEWSLHLAIGVFSFFGQALFQWAFMWESAGILSVVRTVDIVFSFIWSALLLGEDLLWTSALGALMIALVVALIMLNDQIEQRLPARCCGRARAS